MFAISVCASAVVIQSMLSTSFEKALICEVARFVISFVAVVGTAFLMAGGAAVLAAAAG